MTLCVFVLIVDLFFVLLVWEDGTRTLGTLVATERAAMGLSPDSGAGRLLDAAVAGAHEWAFVRSGLSDWLAGSRSGFLGAIIEWFRVVVETAVLGLQLFVARLAVLVISLPLFAAVGAVAIADGVCGWLMRRTSASRESGFIYHRAKRTFPTFLFLLWLVYLIPPVTMDPRLVIPPFVLLFGVALRLRVVYFKKYL